MGGLHAGAAARLVYNHIVAAIVLRQRRVSNAQYLRKSSHLFLRTWGWLGRPRRGTPRLALRHLLDPLRRLPSRLIRPAFLAGFFISGTAQAEELTRFILQQPLSVVREKCALEAVPDWGCVSIIPATDNPNDFICLMRIPVGLPPWDQETLLERLRPQCLEQP